MIPGLRFVSTMLCAALLLAPLESALAANGPARPSKTEKARQVAKKCLGACKAAVTAPAKFVRSRSAKTLTLATMLGGFVATVGARAYGFHLAELDLVAPPWLAVPRELGIWLIAGATMKLVQLGAQRPAEPPPPEPPQ